MEVPGFLRLTKRKVFFITIPVFLISGFLYILCNNIFGLRTLLYLDTKIHDVLTIKKGEVIQREANEKTLLTLSGRVGILARQVNVAIITGNKSIISPNEWKSLDNKPYGTFFNGEILLPSGVNTIFLKSNRTNSPSRTANSFEVNVGEVFIVAGQSNAAGSSNTLFIPKSDLVRTGQLQEDGSIIWKHGADPQVLGGGGSVWPMVGDQLYARLNIPIGFVNVAVGSTSITEWQPNSENFQKLTIAVKSIKHHGPRAILWHQGESDHWLSAGEYYQMLSNLINKVEEETHIRVPWIVALASYKDNMISQAVREGQRKSWKISNVFEGPDTDELEKKHRHDNIHFNEMGTRTAADLWTEKIYNAFFKSPELLKDSILAKAH